ncbi:MAG: hypothetical protein QOE16_2230 [Microbacteriaceae bacterium]|jgi:hypothetical protein|nr:hypothetical protein [Microbacteriaceae bacterium]
MRIVTREILATLAGAGLIVITLAGCATPASPPSAPSATRSPVFASDEEALKAATDAYAAYLAMSDTILSEGGVNPERLVSVATGEALKKTEADVKVYSTRRLHTTGSTHFDSLKIQSYSPDLSAYVCEDVSGIDVVDDQGRSLVKPDRDPRTPFEVGFEVSADGALLLKQKALWTGTDFC